MHRKTPLKTLCKKHLISPELVMINQNAIDLTDQQRKTIVGEMTDAQATFMEYHWDLQNEVQKLAELLAKVEIDEEMALQQLSHVLEREIKIKKAQMGLMIRIKNHLTEKQQLILQGIKSKERKK